MGNESGGMIVGCILVGLLIGAYAIWGSIDPPLISEVSNKAMTVSEIRITFFMIAVTFLLMGIVGICLRIKKPNE